MKRFIAKSQIGEISLWDVSLKDTDAVWRAALTGAAHEAAQQVLQEVVTRNMRITFPYQWETSDGYGNERPYKATTIYVSLPLHPRDEDEVFWQYDLNDAITDIIKGHKNVKGEVVDGKQNMIEMADAIESMAKRLRDAAAECKA